MKLAAILLALASTNAAAQLLQPVAPPVDPLLEYRQCGAPARNLDGSIRRRADVLAAYKRYHPCPSTGKTMGACPGWSINHMLPLASGGCDAVVNLAWMPNVIKSCAAPSCIDRWERTYYAAPHGVVTLP